MAWISFGSLPYRKKKNLMTASVSMLLKSRASLTCFRACFLSEWRAFPSAPCLAGKKELDDSLRLDVVEIARVPDMLPSSFLVRMAWISFGSLTYRKKKTWWQLASRCCWNRARPWHASELVSFLVGLRIYQHPGRITYLGGASWFIDHEVFIRAEKSSRWNERNV